MRQVAKAERAYATSQRVHAQALSAFDETAAAALELEADLCELWAEEIESGSDLGIAEYRAAVREWRDAHAGRCAPRGGISWLLKPTEAVRSTEGYSIAGL